MLLNLGYQFGGRVVSIGAGVMLVAMTTRYLGPDGFGVLTTVLAYCTFFSAFADFGVNAVILTRAGVEGEDIDRLVGASLGLSFVYSAPLMAAIIISGMLVYRSPSSASVRFGIAVVSLSVVASTLSSSILPVLQHSGRLGAVAVGDIAGKLANLAFVGAVIRTNGGIGWIFVATPLVATVNLLVLWTAASRMVKLRPTLDLALWWGIVREAAPIGVSVVIFAIYAKIDAFILSLVRTSYEVGLYGIAYRLVEVSMTIPTFFAAAAFASIASAHATGSERLNSVLGRSIKAMLLAGVPLSIGGAIVAGRLVQLIGGAEFAPARGALTILMCGIVFVFMNVLWANTLIIVGLRRFLLGIALLNLVFNIVLNVALARRFGASGAAVAALCSEAMASVGVYLRLRRTTAIDVDLASLTKVVGAGVLMGVVVFPIRDASLLVVVPVGAVVYTAGLIAVRAISREEIRIVMSRGDSDAP